MYLKIIDARGFTSYIEADTVQRIGWDREVLEGSDHLTALTWVDVDEAGHETKGGSPKWSPRRALLEPATYGTDDSSGLGVLSVDVANDGSTHVHAITTKRDDGTDITWALAGVILHAYLGLEVRLIDAEALNSREFLSGMLFVLVEKDRERYVVGFVPTTGAWVMSDQGKTIDSLLA